MAGCVISSHIDENDNPVEGRCHVYAYTAWLTPVFVVSNVTPAGAEWFVGEMSMVDDHDADQIAAYALQLRRRASPKWFWFVQQRAAQMDENKRLRGAYGRFHTQGTA